MEEAEKRYHSIFDNAMKGIFQWLPDEQRLVTANRAMSEMLHYSSPAEVISQVTDMDRHLFVESESYSRLLQRLEETGSVENFETRLLGSDGSSIWGSINMRESQDKEGLFRFYEGSVINVSERKLAEVE